MKTLLFLMLICLAPCCLKAQETTLGKTKDQMRALVKPYPGIKLAPGVNSDTLINGDLKTIVFYKDNICNASKTIVPLRLMDMIIQKMAKDGYKNIKDNVWISANGTFKVEATVDNGDKLFITETTKVNGAK